MTITQLRTMLRDKYGPRNYRITSDGEIHALTYPTRNDTRGDVHVADKRWLLIGYVDDYLLQQASSV